MVMRGVRALARGNLSHGKAPSPEGLRGRQEAPLEEADHDRDIWGSVQCT